MQTITTFGHEHVQTTFNYEGSARDGLILHFHQSRVTVRPDVIFRMLNHFRGQVVRGGFSVRTPAADGVGAFLANAGAGLSARHASFVCAALQHEGLLECRLSGNSVMVHFPA